MNILLIKGIIIFEVVFYRGALHGYGQDKINNKIVKDISKKIEILADTLSLASVDERPILLSQLEENLRTAAARAFGNDGDKYVDFIIQGIKLKAFNNNKNVPISEKFQNNISESLFDNNQSGERIVKKHILKKITAQIEGYVKKYLMSVHSIEDKRTFLESVRRKMIDIAQLKHSHKLKHGIVSYNNVITNSLNDILRRSLQLDSKRINDEDKQGSEIKDIFLDGNGSEYRRMFNTDVENFNFDEECVMSTALLCSDVNSLSELTCSDGDKVISVKNICDGIEDCPDGTDEINCYDQVAKSLNEAKDFLLEILTAYEESCQMHKINGTFTKRNIKYDSIQTQINIINSQQNNLHINNGGGDVKKVFKNVVDTLNKVVLNLSKGICAHQKNTSELVANARRFHQILGEDLEEALRESALFPKSCICSEDKCISQICVKSCQNACLLKYRLGRWSCPTVNGSSSLSLNAICDGKFDCFDQSDERGCSKGKGRGKFEANEAFLQITKVLEMKMASKENEPVRNELLSLYTSIIKLQNLISAPVLKTKEVKIMRDRSFMLLSLIYGNYMKNTYNSNNAEQMYGILNTINRILVTALKQSNTGNTKVISSYNCFCRKDKCMNSKCPMRCVLVCSVESKLTRYYCKESPENRSVPLEAVCNGKNNCPNEEDEVDCSMDVCRRHHLYSLRLMIQDIGKEHDGSSLGLILKFWRMKANSLLLIAESTGRPTPKYFRHTVKDLLQDLVYAYASLDPTRSRRANKAIQVFSEISQKVIDALKTCGK